MSRRIAVIGTGYVGLVTAVGMADFGNRVIGVDIDEIKVGNLNQGKPCLYEPGIQEYLKRNLEARRLVFTTDMGQAVRSSEVVFIAVGTPAQSNGEADLSQIEAVVASLSRCMNEYKVVVTKSTVPVGTNRWIAEELRHKTGNSDYDVISNPEFLREGKAVHDFFHPDRVVVGVESERAREIFEDVYRSLYLIQTPFVWCDLETAEFIKYASNAFLATKITFINQIANLAEAVKADIHFIAKAMGMDGRISAKFLHPGPGFGGSCFPKDSKAIVRMGEKHNTDMSLIREVVRSNAAQQIRMVEKLKRLTGSLSGKRIAVLGLAFKSETDDVRESPSINIVKSLLDAGAIIQAHDPEALENFRRLFPSLEYFSDEFEAVSGTDALIICTDWNEYRNLDLQRIKEAMRGEVILDTRNILSEKAVKARGFVYEGVGRK